MTQVNFDETVVYQRKTKLMYDNIMGFFIFLTQNVQTKGSNKKGLKMAELHSQELRYKSSVNNFSLLSDRNIPGYIISWMSTQILVVTSPPQPAAKTFHMNLLPSSIPPTRCM